MPSGRRSVEEEVAWALHDLVGMALLRREARIGGEEHAWLGRDERLGVASPAGLAAEVNRPRPPPWPGARKLSHAAFLPKSDHFVGSLAAPPPTALAASCVRAGVSLCRASDIRRPVRDRLVGGAGACGGRGGGFPCGGVPVSSEIRAPRSEVRVTSAESPESLPSEIYTSPSGMRSAEVQDPASGVRRPGKGVAAAVARGWVDPGSGVRGPVSPMLGVRRRVRGPRSGVRGPRRRLERDGRARSEVRRPTSERSLRAPCARQRVAVRVRRPTSEVQCKGGRAAVIRRPRTLRWMRGGREGPRSAVRGEPVDEEG